MGTHTATGRHNRQFKTHEFTPVPQVVQWMATLRCPMTCPHCLAAAEDSDLTDMPLHKVKDLIQQSADLGVEEFLITGGEPLVREDLPEIIAELGRKKVPWSLNTTISPSPELARAIKTHPPMFAAVSLDGPPDVHNRFRGGPGAFGQAMQSIRFFHELPGCSVAAGTTVTSANYPYLPQTFHIVTQSGVDSWGLHLLVPEGRAKERKDLFLNKRQLAGLLRFTARKRHYFKVGLADEMGYCGSWEPLVRDVPLSCGAGRGQCVVLPDGSVVPCTTLDTSTSAGNLSENSLMEIWTNGFAQLRSWQPESGCKTCDYTLACQGGCWLQRRAGSQCYKQVWQMPDFVRTAAGVAVCLGMLGAASASGETQAGSAAAGTRPSAGSEIASLITDSVQERFGAQLDKVAEVQPGIETLIIEMYAAGLPERRGSRRPPRPSNRYSGDAEKQKTGDTDGADKDTTTFDPAVTFFNAFRDGKLPAGTVDRSNAVTAALETNERSLAFAALLWRALLEPLLDMPEAPSRTPEERQALRSALAQLAAKTSAWRAEIVDKKLDPFLARDRKPLRYHFEMSKAMIRPPTWLTLVRDTRYERWGQPLKAGDDAGSDTVEQFLTNHPYAPEKQLTLTTQDNCPVQILRDSGATTLDEPQAFGVFDILVLPAACAQRTIKVKTAGSHPAVTVELPLAAELTYVDLMRLAYDQNTEAIDKLTQPLRYHAGRRGALADPLIFIPLWRNLLPNDDTSKGRHPRTNDSRIWYLADFWLF